MIDRRPDGFASSRLRASIAVHTCFVVGCLLLLPHGGAAGAPPGDDERAPRIPAHVYVAPSLRATFEQMLVRSPTFRSLVDTIASTKALGIAIACEPGSTQGHAYAQIRRYHSGVITAVVKIQSLQDSIELIAHELEHVREAIEGVPLSRLARGRRDGAWEGRHGYETQRAIDLGRRVKAEFHAFDSRLTRQETREIPPPVPLTHRAP
jgi:hypothetical protein